MKETTDRPLRSRNIVMLAFDGCQSLDVTGPWEVFAKANQFAGGADLAGPPTYRLQLASPAGGTVTSNSGLQFGATVAMDSLRGPIDTLLVAGGSDDALDHLAQSSELLPWLQRKAKVVRRIGSVCTGAFALAAAGLLDGRRATTHWTACARLAARHPLIEVDADAIYVADPPLYSSAGITAGIDLALALVEADLGQAVALAVARDLVLFLRRAGGQAQFSAGLKAQADAQASPRLAELIVWMVEHPRSDLSVPALAHKLALSERHFARLFQQATGKTPARFVETLRLDAAKSLLEQTAWPLARVAQRAGFGSVDSLQRSLQRQAGVTPEQYRRRFA